MYYETKTHKLAEVSDANAAANFIRSSEMTAFTAVSWKHEGRKFFAVPDGHTDNPLLEVAVIEEVDGTFRQIESITNGWIDNVGDFAAYLSESQTNGIKMGVTTLIVGSPSGLEMAYFDCGCCGTRFKGNVLYQMKFDQDSGYGICPPCERHY